MLLPVLLSSLKSAAFFKVGISYHKVILLHLEAICNIFARCCSLFQTYLYQKETSKQEQEVLGRTNRVFFIINIIWFVRLLALRPLLAYCASLG
jgi:hypothetical protein